MVLKLYDLAGAQSERRFSPYCWKIKMALRHKGLDVEEIPWLFTEKQTIAFSGQKLVPVLVDGDKTVTDSWEIARYLAFSDRSPTSEERGQRGMNGAATTSCHSLDGQDYQCTA